ncbi:competence/damage-inducible protein A [Allofrancisella guangzhouensis]|uniref:Molybdopterin-binding protein n=1 Tax=Allofrancisella guangzhouensis TaxID=594679 RepID=A0A0A8E9D2_9GAMM|nr:competence/damage-inducible protein A [Allofrancisella guangzhouensis]AJC48786.1 molybdopterin-binding protein [Allofrancisella guangzhouensis]MBK2028007.1 competence/damage-inducible protein A [Allofrancisella guangzhouensis]MBK2044411.1 competence/damage-inducible protein A [Allofrancisella guangzhouensis]MBK2045283.1 competence/damage-inducible protein A [Allofrancisella guangzhouensis]
MKYDFGIIAIGDEITEGDIVNTNSSVFAKHLTEGGFNIGFHISCNDNINDILASILFLKDSHLNIITIGGLGPTEDDLTTQAIAVFFNKELVLDQNSWIKLEQKMIEKYGRVTLGAKKQATFPQGFKIIVNKNGTANGFKLKFEKDRHVYAFPGPPKECIPMLEDLNLKKQAHHKKIIRKKWYIYEIGESFLAEKLEIIKQKYPFVSFKYRIADNHIELKYFYPYECPHSNNIIQDIEVLLKQYL